MNNAGYMFTSNINELTKVQISTGKNMICFMLHENNLGKINVVPGNADIFCCKKQMIFHLTHATCNNKLLFSP